jgi:hypothetical protein
MAASARQCARGSMPGGGCLQTAWQFDTSKGTAWQRRCRDAGSSSSSPTATRSNAPQESSPDGRSQLPLELHPQDRLANEFRGTPIGAPCPLPKPEPGYPVAGKRRRCLLPGLQTGPCGRWETSSSGSASSCRPWESEESRWETKAGGIGTEDSKLGFLKRRWIARKGLMFPATIRVFGGVGLFGLGQKVRTRRARGRARSLRGLRYKSG